MEKNKYTFYSIIIFLIIFIPCSIYGTYMHIKTTANLNHEFKFNNKLYFYENDKLLGTYSCLSDNCDYAINSNSKSSIINSKYTFIKDDKKIYLYEITSGENLKTYDDVRSLMDNVFKVSQNGLWGAISVGTTVNNLLDCNFNDLEFKNNRFIVLKDNKWGIYQGQNELFSSELKIKDFNEELVIVSGDDFDKLYDYQNKEYLETIGDKELALFSKLVLLKRNYNYYIYQFDKLEDNFKTNIRGNFYYAGDKMITHKLTDSTIEFYAGDELLKSIELSVQEND
ncbi:MAG: hypothetical protein IJO33_02885 [Bacilli bacterium]|nr:hypothetical protein [Bacilli bacterium]